MRVILLVALAVLLAGCADRVTDNRPSDWQIGEELLAHMTGRAHSGAFDARVFPQDDMPMPATCVAYRGDAAYAGDTCSIITDSSEHWFPVGDPPWGIVAQWEGRFGDTADSPDRDHPRTVVAFTAHGQPIAYWAGTNHPDASHATE